MKIQTVFVYDPRAFDKQVNELLDAGWKLLGNPTINTVPQQFQRYPNGELECNSKTTFTQVLTKGE